MIGKPEMNDDPRFKTNSDRVKHRDLVDAAVGEWFARHEHDEALRIMGLTATAGAGGPFAATPGVGGGERGARAEAHAG